MHYYVLGKLAVNNYIPLTQDQKSLFDKYCIKEIIKFLVEKSCRNLLYFTHTCYDACIFIHIKEKNYIKHTYAVYSKCNNNST